MREFLKLGDIEVHFLWFDSLGAKSSSLLVKTPEVRLLIDPGAAEMQPSYPLPHEEKLRLREEALAKIKEASSEADLVFISHYHYDHHTLPREAPEIYMGKELWIKCPNLWINRSQWGRARLFISQLCELLGVEEREVKIPKEGRSFPELEDPLKDLPLAMSQEWGDYRERREELLAKGRKWFEDLRRLWREGEWISEFEMNDLKIKFADGREIRKGETRLKITSPLFHGVEFDRIGWVVALAVERRGTKVLYSSDLQGPVIEDYAEWIVREDPDLLILDGPPTYLLGYTLNVTNLRRAISCALRIIRESKTEIIIYDHHLLREKLYRERTKEIYEEAKRLKKFVGTAAELFGRPPLILTL